MSSLEVVYSTFIYDSQCHTGFYQVVVLGMDADNFTSEVCTDNDYCFNISRYNWYDERMLAPPGSNKRSDCRCVEGFHNKANNTQCLDCEKDHFCVNSSQFACAADKMMQGLTSRVQHLSFRLDDTL